MNPVRYTVDVEHKLDDEETLLQQMEDMMVDLAKRVHDKHGHAYHGTHAKLTGLLTGSMEVLPNLAPELAQGLFAHPATYDAVVRLAPGEPEPITDKASGQRGLSIKVLGVTGDRIPGFDENHTQDFVLGLDPGFTAPDARSFKRNFELTGAKSPYLPEGAILALSRVARTVEAGLEAIGSESPNLKLFGRSVAHPLVETFFSQAPIRYGDYIGKMVVKPSPELVSAVEEGPSLGSGDNRFREAAEAFMLDHTASFDIGIQLCMDLTSMSVEDAKTPWSEDESPYRTVAKLTLPPQRPWTEARAKYDDRLAFNPGHALKAHQPLGSVMRARMRAYHAVQQFRQQTNGIITAEPHSARDVP